MSIFVLPPELVLRVADYLEPEDVFNLSQASKSLAYLMRFPALCRLVLMARAPYSPEAVRAQKDGDYARGLRALVKRRDSIRMAKPFQVALLALGTWFVYTNGVLCYLTDGGLLRLLDIKNSADHELVVDVFQMIQEQKLTIPEFTEYKLKPIHFGHGVLTCELSLTNRSRSTTYLIVIRPRTPELLLFKNQPLRDRTVVATTEKYLFVCHPERDMIWNHWAVRQFDLETRGWAHSRPRFLSAASPEGNGVAVAVYEDCFYAASSREPLINIRPLTPGTGPICSYHVAWAPLSGSSSFPLHVSMAPSAWAQFYSGHMSDQRWDFLRLEKDEGTGRLMAIQIRMEYPEEASHPRRMCIKRVLATLGTDHAVPATTNVVNGVLTSPLGSGNEVLTISSLANDLSIYGEGYATVDADSESSQQGSGSSSRASQAKTIVHYGNSSSTNPRYGITQSFVRSYFSTSNSFVDLVNDTLRNNGNAQLLRLRVTTEIPGGGNDTLFWPPRYGPFKPDPRLKELHRIMNPPGFDGDLEWDVDSGSFVYGMKVSSTNHQKAIIYVGFDPTVKLHNLTAFNKAKSGETGASGQFGAVGGGSRPATQGQADTGTDDETRRTFPPLGATWAWLEEPLYFRPKGRNGFDFFG